MVAADRTGLVPTSPARSLTAVSVCANFSSNRNSDRYVIRSASPITAGTTR